MIMDIRFESVLGLWGSRYVYEFLRARNIITETVYQAALSVIEQLKTKLVEENRKDLWRFSFVHRWEPLSSMNQAEWQAEKELFEQSFDQPFKGKIRPGFFLETEAKIAERLRELRADDDVPGFMLPPKPEKEEIRAAQTSASRKPLPKIGRNEKVDVKYEDGTVKRGIKFKNVLKDLESGKCELIK